jgi:hypothetical protein
VGGGDGSRLVFSQRARIIGHLEQCSILTPDWAQVRVWSCFRLSSRLLFLPGWNTADDSTVFMPRRAVPASPGGECCRPGSASRSLRAPARCQSSRRVLLRSEHMFDASAYPALGVVRSLLRQRQRVVAPTTSMNPAARPHRSPHIAGSAYAWRPRSHGSCSRRSCGHASWSSAHRGPFAATWRGFCFHPAGVRPACSSSFASRLFRCVGTGTILASIILPATVQRCA